MFPTYGSQHQFHSLGKVRSAIDDAGYTDWLQIEGAIPHGGAVHECDAKNRQFLRGIFPPDA